MSLCLALGGHVTCVPPCVGAEATPWEVRHRAGGGAALPPPGQLPSHRRALFSERLSSRRVWGGSWAQRAADTAGSRPRGQGESSCRALGPRLASPERPAGCVTQSRSLWAKGPGCVESVLREDLGLHSVCVIPSHSL